MTHPDDLAHEAHDGELEMRRMRDEYSTEVNCPGVVFTDRWEDVHRLRRVAAEDRAYRNVALADSFLEAAASIEARLLAAEKQAQPKGSAA